MDLSESLRSLSHHAYCLIGCGPIKTELIKILERGHKIKAVGNPDFFDRTYETFTIDDAREVKSSAETKPVDESAKKIFILTMNGITVEAQNALLKLLEEPPAHSHFFLIIPSAHLLLPTVKSRLSFIGNAGGGHASDNEILKVTKNFVTSSPKQRMEFVKELMDDISKEKRSKQDAIDFLNALEEVIHEGGAKKNAGALEAVETARKYMNDRAPSLKMLLEYVALNV
jgi:hypothetical protein